MYKSHRCSSGCSLAKRADRATDLGKWSVVKMLDIKIRYKHKMFGKIPVAF